MKKLFLAVMACAALCACSNDDIVVNTSSTLPEGDGVAYLTVKISDVGGTTRATSEGYKYGTSDEQVVTDAYFYLYDDNGDYLAKGSTTLGDGTPADSNPAGNVEWNSETVVAMWGLTYNDITAGVKLLTVLNKPSGIDLTNKTLDEAVAMLAGVPYDNADGSFVMSTSVYYNDDTTYNYTPVAAINFSEEPIDFDNYQIGGNSSTIVDVYVERLAAKVGVTIAEDLANGVAVPSDQFLVGGSEGLTIILLGWNVDAVARDAYLVKHIDGSQWANVALFQGWNQPSDYRSYWAMSPNYDASAELYPYSSHGNTDAAEADATTWLNDYVAYTSLAEDNVVDFGSYAYCGENAVSASVLNDVDNESYEYNGLNAATMVTVKAQIQDNEGKGVNLIKWHGEYLTLDDFLTDMITEVETYDFNELFELVAAAIGEQYSNYGTVIDALVGYLEPYVYYKDGETYKPFDSSFIYLMNEGDGNVSFWFNSSPSHDTEGSNTHNDHSESGNAIPDYYIDGKDIVKKAAKNMDNYDFYIKFNESVTDEETLTSILNILKIAKFIEEDAITEDYYLALSKVKISSSYDWTHDTDDTYYYDGKNFLIRAIDREAAGILDDWAYSGYPQLYNNGMMYYYVPIEHLGSATQDGKIGEAQYGVVRNHWYDITITSVSDLGHAIADENEVIVPTPDIDYYYLGANVNILSWKNITQEVAF